MTATAEDDTSEGDTTAGERTPDADSPRGITDSDEARNLLQSTLEAIQEGLVVQDAAGIVLLSNAAALRLLGRPAEELIGHRLVRDDTRFSNENGVPVQRDQLPSRRALATGQPQQAVLKVERPDERVRWLMTSVAPLYHNDSQLPWAAVTTFVDITERKIMEEALRKNEARLAEAQRVAHIGSWEYDLTTGSLSWSAEMFRLFEFDSLDVEPSLAQLLTRIHPNDVDTARKILSAESPASDNPYELDIRVQLPSGSARWYHVMAKAMRDGTEKTMRFVGTAMDITDRKEAEERVLEYSAVLESQKQDLERSNTDLQAQATTDGLTGLKNHRAFEARLLEEFLRARRHQAPLALLLLDLDHFKDYNDAFGHPAGDEVLRRLGKILVETARESELASRYGGEEFAIILPQTDSAGAVVVAERIRKAVEDAEWPCRPVTASLGVAALAGETDWMGLLERADQALYRSKQRGRNRVTLAIEPSGHG